MLRKCVVVFSVLSLLACGRPGPRGPDVYGYRVAKADVDPVVIERSPQVLYRGVWAYLVDGRWYYPTYSGYVVFIDTPPELARSTDAVETEQSATDMPTPRGPSPNRWPGATGPLAFPPPRAR